MSQIQGEISQDAEITKMIDKEARIFKTVIKYVKNLKENNSMRKMRKQDQLELFETKNTISEIKIH